MTAAASAESRLAKVAALGRWRAWVPPIAALGTVAAAGAGFQRVFGWDHTVLPLGLGIVLGAAAGGGAHLLAQTSISPGRVSVGEWHPDAGPGRRRRSRPGVLFGAVAVVVAVVAAAVLTAMVLASPAGSPGTGLASLGEGWDRILTTALPVPPTADRLPLLAAIVTLAGALAAVAAFRDRPGMLPLFPAAGVLLAALVLGVHGPGSLAATVVPPAVVGAAYLLAVSRPAGEGVAWLPPARVAAAVATGAVVLAVVVAIGARFPLATIRGPVDLRQSLSRPLNLSQVPNPLAQVPAIQAMGSTTMFSASVDQTWLANPANWQLSTLDTYDGINWGSDANAMKVGNVLPVTVRPPGPTTTVQVRATGHSSPWVPTVGVPHMVSPANLNYDPNALVLVDARQRSNSSYTLTATLLNPSLSDLDAAGVPDSAAVTSLVALPACFPAALRTEAQQAVTNLYRPVQEAVAIEQELSKRGGYRINNQALAPDTSCAGLTQLATKKIGTTEQYATAFALMARSVGLPSRLAVGFTPGIIHGHQVTVPGDDATVWPEVEFANIGWVPFAPSPTATGSGGGPTTVPPTTTPSGPKSGAQSNQPESAINRVRQTVAGGATTTVPPATTVAPPPHHQSGAGRWWWVAIPIAIVASAGTVVLVRLAARRRRRARRRRASTPGTRVVGAWQEILDQLTLLGSGPSGLTPSEVVGEAARLAPPSATPVARVARAVDVAVYASEPDESLGPLADEAWSASDAARRALTDVVPLGLKVRLALVGAGSPPAGSGDKRTRAGRGASRRA